MVHYQQIKCSTKCVVSVLLCDMLRRLSVVINRIDSCITVFVLYIDVRTHKHRFILKATGTFNH